MCTVCTVAIIGGLGLSRWLKVDDTVSGIWIGALLVTVIYYSIDLLRRLKIKFPGRDFLVAAIYYAAVFIPLYSAKIIGHPLNTIWGVDKLIIGTAAGTIIFVLAIVLYQWLKINNGGHAHFPFEKVVVPIVSLLITSGIFYLITR